MTGSVDANIFELAPIAMWIEDFSEVKAQFDAWRAAGVTDLRAFLKEDRTRVAECSSKIRILQVNRKTLDLFEAEDLNQLIGNLGRVFCDDMWETHI
ncbi:MAG: PAS domain-containing protein, partial [Arenimonas sp.]|nr:PAS domain-containing protein [Arenimonas sp.]